MNRIGDIPSNSGHAGRVTLPARKRLNHRGPLSIDVSSAWYFITICADGHAPWVGSRVPRDRDSAVGSRVPRDRMEPVGSRVPRDRNVEQMDFAAIADSILSAARWYHEHGKWRLALFLVMPDHLHFIVNIGGRGATALPRVIANFKHLLSARYGLRFQRDFFDTRLRDDAHFAEEYDYILGNPVRKGLCAAPADWPYSIAFTRDGEEIPVGRRVPTPPPVGARVPRDRADTPSAPCDCAQQVGARRRDGRAVSTKPPLVELLAEKRSTT